MLFQMLGKNILTPPYFQGITFKKSLGSAHPLTQQFSTNPVPDPVVL